MTDLIERQAVRQMLAEFLTGPQFLALDKLTCAIPAATITGTKPSIDWSHLHPDFNWVARDADGDGHAYTHKPEVEGFQFMIDDGKWTHAWTHAESFASYTPGTCDWRDSLIMRPGHVEGGE